ncbi:MAG: DUF2378 family protein [Myxococcales bacterium]|nr:MAG: DUF2378 family protein [Myxococcales bacterium]
MRPAERTFVDPPWDHPLDVDRALLLIPESATISGMFYQALAEGGKRRGVAMRFKEARYLPFRFYSLREFGELLVRACPLLHPGVSVREGLRRIGRAGPAALLKSTLGKVTLGAASGVHEVVTAFAKTYPINLKPSSCTVEHADHGSMVVRLSAPHFLDCHHVGAFEGTLEHAGVKGTVRIAKRADTAADLLLEWR